jgi:hypothetical protein
MSKKLNIKEQMKSNVTLSVTSGLVSNEAIKQKVIILNELRDLIQPLQVEEFEILTNNIVQNGCKDSIVIWQTSEKIINPNAITDNEKFVIIDGHNRYKICTKHNLSFNIVLMYFDSIQAVKNYMLDLQMGRRNLSPTQLAYYRGVRYNTQKITDKIENFSGELKEEKTSQIIAKQYNVDEKTIRRDGEFASGLEKLEPTFRKEILAGEQKVSKKNIQQLAKIITGNAISSMEELNTVIAQKPVITMMSTQNESKISKELYDDIQISLKNVYETHDKMAYQKLLNLIVNLGELI